MFTLEASNTVLARDEIDEGDFAGCYASLYDLLDRDRRAAASGQHRIDEKDSLGACDVRRELAVEENGLSFVVALDENLTNGDVWKQMHDGIQHAVAGAQDANSAHLSLRLTELEMLILSASRTVVWRLVDHNLLRYGFLDK